MLKCSQSLQLNLRCTNLNIRVLTLCYNKNNRTHTYLNANHYSYQVHQIGHRIRQAGNINDVHNDTWTPGNFWLDAISLTNSAAICLTSECSSTSRLRAVFRRLETNKYVSYWRITDQYIAKSHIWNTAEHHYEAKFMLFQTPKNHQMLEKWTQAGKMEGKINRKRMWRTGWGQMSGE